MRQQGVDKGAVRIAGGRMDDKAGGLVDDKQMCILERDRERQSLRLEPRILRIGEGHDETLAAEHPRGGIARRGRAAHDMARLDQTLEPGAR